MSFTLRQITDALWNCGPKADDDSERARIYDRARMLRDRGLILTSGSRNQGAAMLFSEADVAAATVAITASLNGCSWGIIGAVNAHLRAVGNTQGRPEFERQIEQIRSGAPIFARLDIVKAPFDSHHAFMGREDEISLAATPPEMGTTQIFIWPVSAIARPVLEHLAGQAEV